MTKVTAFEARAPMRDGVLLTADVTLVDDGTPKPVILTRTPYSRAGARMSDDPIALAREGWVHVAQDVRGRFESEGKFLPFESEREDGADTVEWCAAQPWCDGTVVGWGGSYLGTTQLLAAAARPRPLKAVAPVVTGGRFGDGFILEGGVVAIGFVLAWAANMAASDPRLTEKQRERALRLASDPETLYRTPLEQHPLRKLFPILDQWFDPSYQWPDALRPLRRRSIPGYHVAGWWDLFGDLSIDTHAAMVAGGAPQRLVIGPWTHAGLFQDATAEEAFGMVANGMFVRGEALQFLRAAAAGSTSDLQTGVRAFVTGAGEWWDLPSWPPPSSAVELWLGDGGELTPDRPEGAQQYRLEHDPEAPVPTRGGRLLQLVLPMPGPCDQRPLEDRPDVIVYTATPSRSAMTLAGEVRATIYVESTAATADLVVKLVDVHSDGRSVLVADGIQRVATTPGRATRAAVRVGSVAHQIKPGHRVRVEIAGSNFPRFESNPNAGEHTLLCGGRRASSITLPVVTR